MLNFYCKFIYANLIINFNYDCVSTLFIIWTLVPNSRLFRFILYSTAITVKAKFVLFKLFFNSRFVQKCWLLSYFRYFSWLSYSGYLNYLRYFRLSFSCICHLVLFTVLTRARLHLDLRC